MGSGRGCAEDKLLPRIYSLDNSFYGSQGNFNETAHSFGFSMLFDVIEDIKGKFYIFCEYCDVFCVEENEGMRKEVRTEKGTVRGETNWQSKPCAYLCLILRKWL